MNDTIKTEYFKLVEGYVERTLDALHGPWSTKEFILLDWCVWNMEATNDK